MCADLVLRKRAALTKGEVGLFLDTIVFEQEWETIHQGVDVTVTATQSRNVKQFRLFWALAKKIADSGVLGDADARDVVNWLLLKCKHVRYVTNKHRDGIETTPIVKSIRFAQMDQTEFNRLFARAMFIVVSEILPDMPEGDLRAEVEQMAGVTAPEPEPPKTRRRRARPDHDPITGEIPATEPVMASLQETTSPAHPAPEGPPPDGVGTVSTIPAADAPQGGPDTAPASPVSAAKPAPLPAGGDAGPVPDPKTVAEWQLWCKDWLDAASDDPETADIQIMNRWNKEKTIRNACGVTADDRQRLFAYYTAILEAKREAQARKL
jgi:hypothetical protein